MSAIATKTPGSVSALSFRWLGAAGFFVALLVFALQDRLPPWAFMWLLAFAIFCACKWVTWWTSTQPTSPSRSLSYLLLWLPNCSVCLRCRIS